MEASKGIPIGYPANPGVEPLLRRGYMALEDMKWDDEVQMKKERESAIKIFNEILNSAPECALAYLGLAMAERKVGSIDDFFAFYDFDDLKDKNIRRAREFSDGELKARFEEEDRARAEQAARLPLVMKRAVLASGMLFADNDRIIARKADGTILSTDGSTKMPNQGLINAVVQRKEVTVGSAKSFGATLYPDGRVVVKYKDTEETKWTNIIAISCPPDHEVLGLGADGTMKSISNSESMRYGKLEDMRHIVAFAEGFYHTVYVNADGRVMAVVWKDYGQGDVSHWRDVIAVAAAKTFTVGLRTDGTLVVSGECPWKNEVESWKLFDNLEAMEKACEAYDEAEKAKQAALNGEAADLRFKWNQLYREESDLQNELSHLKGLFAGKRRKEIEARLADIQAQQDDIEASLAKIEKLL